MKKKVTVSAIQMHIKTNDINANLKTAEKLVAKIFQKNKTDLIVFPEDCITGPIPDRLDLKQNENSNSIKFFQKLATQYNTYIVCGSFIKKIKDKYFNTSLLINNKGKIILEYHKNNLWISEREYATPGEDIKCADTPLGKIGIIICWDLTFPETSRKLARQGVDIICCPSYWPEEPTDFLRQHTMGSEKIFVNTLCRARAIENEVLFIFSNGAGDVKFFQKAKLWQSQHIGQTQICAPIIGTAARIDDNSEGTITYTYNTQIAKDAEKIFQIRSDLNSYQPQKPL